MPTDVGGSMKIKFPDRCLKFGNDGVRDYVTTPNSNKVYIPSGSKLSLSCWYKHNNQGDPSNTASFVNLIGKEEARNWGLSLVPGTNPCYVFHGNTAHMSYIAGAHSAYFVTGSWYHICGVYNGGDKIGGDKFGCIYINGILNETVFFKSGISDGVSTSVPKPLFEIGADTYHGSPLSGCIYDVRVWSGCALTADEVKLVYNGLDVQKDKLVLWYKCDDRDGSTLKDYSNSELDGAITGATWDDLEMTCWCTRWDESDYSLTLETFLTAGNRNLLFNSVTPTIVRELKTILGKPWVIDGTYKQKNTLNIEPISGFGLSSLRKTREIVVKSISDTVITPEYFNVKIEGLRTKDDVVW